MCVIKSVDNERVKNWSKLHQKKYRYQKKQFIVAEEHLITEALSVQCVDMILIHEKETDIFGFKNTCYVSEKVLLKLSPNQSVPKYVAICHMLPEKRIDTNNILVLDGIQDPGNLGTLIRSALAFGFRQVVLSDDCVDLYNPKVIAATQGAMFQVNILKTALVPYLTSLVDYDIVAFSLDTQNQLRSLKVKEKVCIVLGNEGSGIRDEVYALCTKRVKIEMETFDSLNVGVAGSIAMYYLKDGLSKI